MLFYNTSQYICPCGDTFPSGAPSLPSSLAPRNLHQLADLYFCPKCHIPRCSNCCDSAVVAKYCANCMSDYTALPGMTRCTKNCFECPECTSPLTVSIHDDPRENNPGKQFRFTCNHCPYIYTTKTVAKPAPLSTILKHEQPSYFLALQEKHAVAHKLREFHESGTKMETPKLSRAMLAKMAQMGIDPIEAKAKTSDQNSISALISAISKTSGGLGDEEKWELALQRFTPQPVDIDADFVAKPHAQIPLGNHLTAKVAYACNLCGTRVLTPTPDPRLMKYTEKELAPETIPLVTAKVSTPESGSDSCRPSFALSSDTKCVLSVVNPTLAPLDITVSTLEQIPSQVSGTDYKVAVSLPVTSTTISARREKANVLDTIPTVFLTGATPTARGEALARTIRRESARRNADPHEPFVEHGHNWASMPFAVTVYETDDDEIAGKSTDEILNSTPPPSPSPMSPANTHKNAPPVRPRIPFYITVDTRVPSTGGSRSSRALKYGFWVVCDVA